LCLFPAALFIAAGMSFAPLFHPQRAYRASRNMRAHPITFQALAFWFAGAVTTGMLLPAATLVLAAGLTTIAIRRAAAP
jgi:hypothetical protein